MSAKAPKPYPKYGLILAAGTGRRFGGYKQLAQLGGRPVLLHSIRAFERSPWIVGFVVVAPPRAAGGIRRTLERNRVTRLLAVVRGGKTRSGSVQAGLLALPEHGYVAVHDAVRPFINPTLLIKGFQACARRGAALLACPVTDTLKQVKGNEVIGTVERADLVAAQTPQFFDLQLLRRAHHAAGRAGLEATDDCALVERLGVKPVWLKGPRANLKITTPEDLELCEALV
jgi:2-C-methyl-D-erythritol 4-phosphate cytidylyltransferase